MKLMRRSILTDSLNTMEVPISEFDFNEWQMGDEHASVLFPHLTPEELRFVVSGVTPVEDAALAAEIAEEIYLDDAVEESSKAYA